MNNKFTITDFLITIVVILILVSPIIFVTQRYNLYNYLKDKKTPKIEHKEPLHYVSSSVIGNVQSIHILGRTEVVPVHTIQLTRYFYEDNLWVLEEPQTGGIIQPTGRKGYFMPVMSGNLNTKYGSAQLVDIGNLENGENDEEKWSEFRVANLIFKSDEPIAVHYKHYNYKDGEWSEIASYSAKFNLIKENK
jgi:hypothetical protein